MILSRYPDPGPQPSGLKFIGYWKERDYPDLPTPQDFVDPTWAKQERNIVVAYLKNGLFWEGWMGESYCRFGCDGDDLDMGCTDLSDGVYVWPYGLAHYLERHSVKPPAEFIDHVLRRASTSS